MKKNNFRKMFVVDPQITNFKKGDSLGSESNVAKKHRFNIRNMQINEDEDEDEDRYFDAVGLQLHSYLKTSEIEPFLEYHYKNAHNQLGLLGYVRYDLWDLLENFLVPIKPHRKVAVKEWVEKMTRPLVLGKVDGQSVDEILTKMFPDIFLIEIERIKENLKGAKKPVKLTYIGTKEKFYKDLGKLRIAGYDRTRISQVFTEFCEFQKNYNSNSEIMKQKTVYNKIIKIRR